MGDLPRDFQPSPLYKTEETTHLEAQNEAVAEWNELALDGVETHIVPGLHREIFDEPAVAGLSEKIIQCLEEMDLKHELAELPD